jgi:hypothetical protein
VVQDIQGQPEEGVRAKRFSIFRKILEEELDDFVRKNVSLSAS